jgi:hypothetical protein
MELFEISEKQKRFELTQRSNSCITPTACFDGRVLRPYDPIGWFFFGIKHLDLRIDFRYYI